MTKISPQDPKLTAYALGELQGQERAEIEAALRDDPEARAIVEQTRALAGQLTEALAHEPGIEAEAPAAGSVSLAPDGYRPHRAKVLRFPQLYFVIGGLAAACVAMMVVWRDEKPAPEVKHYQVITLNPPGQSSTAVELPITSPESTVAEGADAAPASGVPDLPSHTTPELSPDRMAAIASRAAVPAIRSATETNGLRYQPENAFVATSTNARSTFGLDVNAASYADVRRFIESGRLPPRSDVRIDELLNAFSYRDPAPSADGKPLAASVEVAAAPWAPGHRLVRIGLAARSAAAIERPPANLVFLLDVSASMDAPDKLPLIKQAMRRLIERLRPNDRVAIVTYAGTSGVALPSTPAARAGDIIAALEGLNAGGSTNGAMGIQAAYDVAKANFVADGINRVILCTDGDFNVGTISQRDLGQLVEEKAKTGVALTVLGFGMATHRDPVFDVLAARGGGNNGFIETRTEADVLLARQINEAPVLAARDVRVQVEFNPDRVTAYRLIGYEDRLLQSRAYDDPAPGIDVAAGYGLTALYEIVPAAPARGGPSGADAAVAAASARLATVTLHYREAAGEGSQVLEVAAADPGKAFEAASADLQFAAAIAEFGMILRDSPHRGKATMADVIAWARAGAGKRGDDPFGYRAEFIDLARRTETLLQ
jgi:Ca-activated chloride channel homolog